MNRRGRLADPITHERILVITSSYPRYPGDSAGHFVHAEVKELLKKGAQVTVLAAGAKATSPPLSRDDLVSPEEEPMPSVAQVIYLGGASLFDHPGVLPRLRSSPLRLLAFAAPSRRLWSWGKALTHEERRSLFDRVIVHWLLPSALPWALLLPIRKIPLEVVIHGSDLQLLLKLPARVRSWLLRLLSKRGATLRFVSQRMKEELDSAGLPSDLLPLLERSSVQASPIVLPQQKSQEDARIHLGLPATQRWAVVVGRLISQKRIRTVLNAASLVPELRLAVLGEGPLLSALKEEFPQVRFLGHLPRNETLLWITAADLCLTASKVEGAPTVVREARSLGTAVVASVCGDLALWSQSDPELWLVD